MRHFFKERIVLSFQNTFSDIFLFSWSYPYDRVKNIEGYYRNFTDYFITKTASEERVPIDDISVTRSIVKNEDGDHTVLTMKSGIILKMPPDMSEKDYNIIIAQINVFLMIYD